MGERGGKKSKWKARSSTHPLMRCTTLARSETYLFRESLEAYGAVLSSGVSEPPSPNFFMFRSIFSKSAR